MCFRKGFSYLAVAVSAVALTACGSLQKRSKDDVGVKQIRRAAVVAFHVDEPTAVSVETLAVGTIAARNSPYTDAMYKGLSDAFAEKMGWEMLPLATIVKNPGYRKAYDLTMKGFQNKFPHGDSVTRFEVAHLMDADGLRILDVTGRDQLMNVLGVDALIMGRPYVYLNGFTVMGMGSHHPATRIAFEVYRKGDVKPTWFEGGLDGDEQESISKSRFFNEDDLNKKALASAQSAFSKINSVQ